jgi:hypothetical protein
MHNNTDRTTEFISQDLKCLCSKSTTVLSQWTIPKTKDVCLLHFYYIRNKKNILYRNVCILYIQYRYTLQVCMSASGIVMHYKGWGCHSHNPQEIHCFKWKYCVWFAWFQFVQCFFRVYPWHKTRPACIILSTDSVVTPNACISRKHVNFKLLSKMCSVPLAKQLEVKQTFTSHSQNPTCIHYLTYQYNRINKMHCLLSVYYD